MQPGTVRCHEVLGAASSRMRSGWFLKGVTVLLVEKLYVVSPFADGRLPKWESEGYWSMPLTISSVACSGSRPCAIKVSNSFLSTVPMAASCVTLASG